MTEIMHPVARALAVDLAQELETAQAHVVALKAENRDLRILAKRPQGTADVLRLCSEEQVQEVMTEITRPRDTVPKALAEGLELEIAELKAENTRLRSELEQIAALKEDQFQVAPQWAREALKAES